MPYIPLYSIVVGITATLAFSYAQVLMPVFLGMDMHAQIVDTFSDMAWEQGYI